MQIDVNVTGLDALKAKFQRFQVKQRNWSQELFDIGILLLRSQDLNFRDQGRPDRWTPSQAAINRNGMTLVDTGRLRRSVSILGNEDNIFKVQPLSLVISTDVPYAKYLQDERPFLMIQEEDIRNMELIMNKAIERIF